MMSKHTPGPWYIGNSNDSVPFLHIYCADSKGIMHNSRSDEERMRNARLIAAAPCLLEALDNILKVIDGEGGTKPNAREMARAAIAKARGEV